MPKYFNIDAAFSSTKENECYVFVKDKYVVLNYAPGKIKKEIISGPRKIADGFPMFANTIFENGIDCAVDTKTDEAFIFSGNLCAKTTAPHSTNAEIRLGPIPITDMFPILRKTVCEKGIDASLRSISNDRNVYLFKGDEIVVFDMISNNHLMKPQKISDVCPPLLGTVFESGIDAAFNSHVKDEIFIFKGQYYAHYNMRTDQFINGFIKRIHDHWPALHGILQ